MRYRSALSLPVLAASLVFLGPNFAAARSAATSTASNTVSTSTAGSKEAMRMVPARADLTKPLDARRTHAGQQFEAKLNDKVQLKDGTVLPKGTKLEGRVVNDRAGENGRSTMTLRFTQAELKNGKKIPIKATIVGLYSAADQYVPAYGETQPPNYWTPNTLQVDQVNALNHVDLHSRIAAHNSGVLQSSKDDIHFASGTEFALAIAQRS
jgi:hypothetical protein